MIGESLTSTDNVPLCKHCGKPVRNIVKVTGMDATGNLYGLTPDAHAHCSMRAITENARIVEAEKKDTTKPKFWEYYNRRSRRRS